jgi:D-alanyl-D-alanine carboxypeptidase
MAKCMTVMMFFCLLIAASCGGGSSSGPVSQERVDEAVETFRSHCSGLAQAEVPGAAAAVSVQGRSPLLVASGVTNLDAGREIAKNDLFHAGSITKTFTAAWIMQLDQEGVLSIDDVISAHLAFPKGSEITLRQLLAHTSGITAFTSMPEFASWFEVNPYPAPLEVLEFMRQHPRQSFEPGQGYEYSNSNYYLLGIIGEIASGRSWHEEIRNRFLDPYGLGSTYIYGLEQGPASEVQGYTACPETYCQPADFMAIGEDADFRLGWAAGGIVTTPKDLAKWMRALVAGPVLNEAGRREMQTVTPQSAAAMEAHGEYAAFNKGVGLCLFKYSTPEAGYGWGHDGQIGGFGNVAAYFPGLESSLALSANEVSADVNKGLRLLVSALAPLENDSAEE